VLAAASPRLPAMISEGLFRTDLAYRLDVVSLEMPPLRQRKGDAILLGDHFAARFAAHYQLPLRRIDAASIAWMEQYSWPGNVRELENLVHRHTLLCTDQALVLHPDVDPVPPTHDIGETISYQEARSAVLTSWERVYLLDLLHQTQGNVTLAAQLAGKERRALGKLLKKHGIDRGVFGAG
jgi:DNA-binding NtrC family response regulator